MKKLTVMIAVGALTALNASYGELFVNEYSLRIRQQVPRIYDNSTSLGYRKYQGQTIKGTLYIVYDMKDKNQRPRIFVDGLENRTHKMSNGKYITYKTTINNSGDLSGPITRVNLIGNNRTDVFKTASIVFYMDAEPSYNVGKDDEDNSLLCTFSGNGSSSKKKVKAVNQTGNQVRIVDYGKQLVISSVKGVDAGTLGCGCMAYGHKSPTRVAFYFGHTDIVDDVSASFGKWYLTYKSSYVVPESMFPYDSEDFE